MFNENQNHNQTETPRAAAPAGEQTATFASFKLPNALNQALERMKYINPTPVQAKAIPSAMEGRDVLGSAQTGTGKTGAFCIPIVAKMLRESGSKALIMAPTRELAAQTMVVIQQLLGNNRDIRTALLIGGESMGRQFDQLRNRPRIIVGTPGRINDHLRRAPSMLQGTDLVVLDEADRMLDMGFSVQIDTIFEQVDPVRQTLMFSATFPQSILKFAQRYLNDPVRVAVQQKQVSADNINHEILHTNDGAKYGDLTQQLDKRAGSIIVFVKTQHGADRLSGKLERENHDVGVLHGGLKQRQRDRVVASFRAGKIRIMVATDVAARGLDVPHIEHVINYDLPQNPEDYVHRIGRTARAGAKGNAIAFVVPSERGKWNAINRTLNPGSKPEREERSEGGRRFGNKRPDNGHGSGNGGGYGKKPWQNKGPRRDDRAAAPAPADDFFGEEGDQIVQLRQKPARPHHHKPHDRLHDRLHGQPRGERAHNKRGYGERSHGERSHSERAQGERDGNRAPRPDFRQDRDGNRQQTERPDRDGNRANGHGFKQEGFKKDGFKKRGFNGPKQNGPKHNGQKQGGPKQGNFKKSEGGRRGSGRAA